MAKITFIGEKKWSDTRQKNYRKVSIDGKDVSAWDRIASALDDLKVGDEVEATLSPDGKYLNKISKVGTPNTTASTAPAGNNNWKSGNKGEWKPDPEKDASVYTSYVLEYLLPAQDIKTPKEAVDLLFDIRKLVKAKLAGEKENL